MSSIFLFGAMRPTNRKFVSPSLSHCSSAGARRRVDDAVDVDGDGEDAGRRRSRAPRVPAGCTRSRPSARSVRPASDASSRRPSAASRKMPGIVRREEARRRDVVVLEHAAARQRGERLGHRRRQREVEDRDVAAPRPPGRRTAAPRRAGRRRSSARRDRTRGPGARSRSRTRRALSPIASPRCAAGTHWLMTIVRCSRATS